MTPETLAQIQASAYREMAPWSARDFAELLQQDSVHLFTGTQAFLLLRVVLDEAEILAFATDPKGQNQGQGSHLIRRMHKEAADLGVGIVYLEVAATNDGAQRFYTRHGYVETGRRAGYYHQPGGHRSDAVLMSRALTP